MPACKGAYFTPTGLLPFPLPPERSPKYHVVMGGLLYSALPLGTLANCNKLWHGGERRRPLPLSLEADMFACCSAYFATRTHTKACIRGVLWLLQRSVMNGNKFLAEVYFLASLAFPSRASFGVGLRVRASSPVNRCYPPGWLYGKKLMNASGFH